MIQGITWTALIGAAAVDSINPCTLAILLILLTTLLTSDKKNKIIPAGIAFASAIYISYFLMGLGVYSALKLASSYIKTIYYTISLIAVIVGFLSIKAYFNYRPGFFSVEIPATWRPLMKNLISKATSVIGAFLIGFACSLFLLPCSSGPYLFILGLLANASTRISAIPLLLIYNFIFILPMVIITMAVYIGKAKVEEISKWREKNIKLIHLISGIVMLCLGLLVAISVYFGLL